MVGVLEDVPSFRFVRVFFFVYFSFFFAVKPRKPGEGRRGEERVRQHNGTQREGRRGGEGGLRLSGREL